MMLVLCTAMEAVHKLIIHLLHEIVGGCLMNVAFFDQGCMLGDEADLQSIVATEEAVS